MNVRRISWGLIVLFVGLVLLFSNLGFIDFNWSAVFSLWPVLLIIFGVSFILPEKTESKYIMALVTVGVLVLFAYQGMRTSDHDRGWVFNRNTERKELNSNRGQDSRGGNTQHFSKSLDPETKFATLKIEGGAVVYRIGKNIDDLFSAETSSTLGGFSLLQMHVGSGGVKAEKVALEFKMRNHKNEGQKNNVTNSAEINLSSVPVWDIELEIGAGKADFDLSDYRIRKLDIEGGVSSIKVRMGMPFENETSVNFDGGLASFELAIPEGAACRIVSNSALSSHKFTGFIKQEDGSYITDNYNNAEKKFAVSIDSGLSSFSVNRY